MRRLALSLACVLACFFSPSLAAPSPRLRLATWNIAWLSRHPGQGEIPRTLDDYARLRRYADRLDADVVAFQEVDGPEAAARVFDPARWRVHVAAHAGAQRVGFAWRRGIEARPLPDVTGLSLERLRSGADLEVRFGGRVLRLLSIHLKAGCVEGLERDRNDRDCKTLFRQLPALEAWIDARAREGVPFAVLGDFNRHLRPGEPFWTEIDDADPPASDLVDPFEGRPPACWDGRHRDHVDHVILGRDAARWLDPVSPRERPYAAADAAFEKVLSDHCPLEVTLAPGAPPSPSPRIPSARAREHVGEIATVCGTVASARYLEESAQRFTFLNFGAPYPDQDLAAVIPGDRRAAFGSPEKAWNGKAACVTGAITVHRGRPQVILTDPGQIRPDGG